MKKKTKEEFIIEAENIHKDKFNYSEFIYNSTHKKGIIICKVCNYKFEQSPANHLKGQGCPNCYKKNKIKWNQKTFLLEVEKIYDKDIYSYFDDYIDSKTKIKIYCNKHEEYFYKKPYKHINNKEGCPKCGFNTYSLNEFIIKSNETHLNKYNYSKTVITNNTSDVEIICNEIDDLTNEKHGSFFTSPTKHINRKYGCPKCGSGYPLTKEKFIINSNNNHKNNNYSYDLVNYINSTTPVNILCNKCNEYFLQTPEKHMIGQGCSKCSKLFPQSEREIIEFLNSLDIKNIISHYKLNNNQEIDIYLPDYKIGIEYNGDYWHSDLQKPKKYHYNKTTICEEEGIRLIHIWEYEWVNKKEQIKSYIKAQLGLCDDRIYARKCEIRETTLNECLHLLNYHQQGKVNAQKYIGLYYNNDLILVMLFSKPRLTKKAEWEVVREICKEGYSIIGGKSKVFNYFIKTYKPQSIVSFVDRAKFTGKSYKIMGFKLNHIVESRYDWVFTDHVFKKRQPKIYNEMKKLYNEGKVYRIWDAGRYCYIWYANI